MTCQNNELARPRGARHAFRLSSNGRAHDRPVGSWECPQFQQYSVQSRLPHVTIAYDARSDDRAKYTPSENVARPVLVEIQPSKSWDHRRRVERGHGVRQGGRFSTVDLLNE